MDFKYAPTKMIIDYNKGKEGGSCCLKKTGDPNICQIVNDRYDPLNGKKIEPMSYDMSIPSLKLIKARFSSDLKLLNAFIKEAEALKA